MELIKYFEQTGFFNDIDIQFTQYIAGLLPNCSDTIKYICLILSYLKNQGHSCLDLHNVIPCPLPDITVSHKIRPQQEWQNELINCPLVSQLYQLKPPKPFILDNNKLFFHRYWTYEKFIIDKILTLAGRKQKLTDPQRFGNLLKKMYTNDSRNTDWQQVASYMALTRQFSIISGGPGTGKTTTIMKILYLYFDQFPESIIYLAAPTGKAALRINESIKNNLEHIKINSYLNRNVLDKIAEIKANTIHRLFRYHQNYHGFYYNSHNPLVCNLMILDETSMVDISLLYNIFAALQENTGIILLGDMFQLASINTGSVFGDLCRSQKNNAFSQSFISDFQANTKRNLTIDDYKIDQAKANKPLKDNIIILQKNFRFTEDSCLLQFSNAVKQGTCAGAELALQYLCDKNIRELQWIDTSILKTREKTSELTTVRILADIIKDHYESYIKSPQLQTAFKNFNRFRILCAVKEGFFGIKYYNYLVEHILSNTNLLSCHQVWYENRPILIQNNDYVNNLFNGDIGITRQNSDGITKVHFFDHENSRIRSYSPGILTSVETVFAMTIHKSQGSEFDHILIVLPDEEMSILNNELIYTAITRARKSVTIIGSKPVFKKSIQNKTQRISGILDKLSYYS